MRTDIGAVGIVLAVMGVQPLQHAQAQANYPNKPIRFVIPYPPGGGTDLIGRLVGAHLSDALGQPVVIDNKPGAGSVVGTEIVARAQPDGYTLLFATSAGLVINPLLRKVSYNPQKDFTPISLLVTSPLLLAVSPSVPAGSVRELIDFARKSARKLNYASAGIGAPNHIASELFKHMAGVDMVHVPFKGFGLGIVDLMSGQVQVMFNPVTGLLPYVKSGKVKGIAVTSTERYAVVPELPTVAESLPGYDYQLWYSVVGPAGMPAAIQKRLNAEIVKFLNDADTAKKLASLGADARSSSPEGLMRLADSERQSLGKIIRSLNVKAE